MNGPQPTNTVPTAQTLAEAPSEGMAAWFYDDVPLGCECANPALQIERWGQEAPGVLRQLY